MSAILIIALVIILLLLAWALFGTKEEPAVLPEEKKPEPADEPEKILRRRAADRAIEKEFPVEPPAEAPLKEQPHDAGEIAGSIQLPFSANDIIPDNSKFKLYKRTLINSEIYARRGDIETAVALFKGVHDRILDSTIRAKISDNIEYLNRFRQRREEDYKKKSEAAAATGSTGLQAGELRLKIDGPVPQTINIGMPEKAIDHEQIISKISEQISKELNNIRGEVERLKAKPEEKFDLDDYAEFAGLQHELKTLKEKFLEITKDREQALTELSRLRELKEQQVARDAERDQSDILGRIKNEMENLNDLKGSLDKLHTRIDDMTKFGIPETDRRPSIIEARYEAPIPIHFDTKPVLEILEKLNLTKKQEPAPEETAEVLPEPELPPEELFTDEELKAVEEEFADLDELEEFKEIPEEEISGELTLDEIDEFREEAEQAEPHEPEEDLFPEMEVFPEFEESAKTDEMPALDEIPELTDEEAAEIAGEELPAPEKEEEITGELTLDEIEEFSEEPAPAEEEVHAEAVEEIPPAEELFPEPEIEELPEIHDELPEEKISEPVPESVEEIQQPEQLQEEPEIPDEILTKEKEIEKHTDADEDPNDFDLVSEYGKPKDDSTLTDEDIFEKILKDDRKKDDDSQFEIIGERQKDEQEYSMSDKRLDEKEKAEQDFYRKFIKPDRIKKRELPILKVSFDFKKLPDEFSLSREQNILEYSFYKYKPMLQKADEYIKQRRVKDAINYYKVVADQNIPIEFKAMIRRNIRDLTEYLEKYLGTE